RREQGTAISEGQSVDIEIFDEGPDKQALVRHMPKGESITVFDGVEGWSVMPGRPLRDMRGADIDAARIDADLQFPLHIKQFFAELRVEYPEKIGDHEAYVVSGQREGQPPVKLYFDEQSGLLVRLVRYVESPLGALPIQVDYADYRDVDGVKTPFRRTIVQPGASSTIELEQIQQNVRIDEATFIKPTGVNTESKPPGR
ncbi:MAG: hypothetical protein WA653_03255, partial [Candidatus Sulfotelmatobacter sp.]